MSDEASVDAQRERAEAAEARAPLLAEALRNHEQVLRRLGENARDNLPSKTVMCSSVALLSWADVLDAALADVGGTDNERTADSSAGEAAARTARATEGASTPIGESSAPADPHAWSYAQFGESPPDDASSPWKRVLPTAYVSSEPAGEGTEETSA